MIVYVLDGDDVLIVRVLMGDGNWSGICSAGKRSDISSTSSARAAN